MPIILTSHLKSKEENDNLCDSDEGIRAANDNLQAIIDKLVADNSDEMIDQL